MRRRCNGGRRAFVFLAAFGVMIVVGLMVFAMAGATQFSYRRSGTAQVDVQEQVLLQSAVEYALYRIRRGEATAEVQPLQLWITTDHARRAVLEANVWTLELGPDHQLYQRTALDWRPGDVLVEVECEALRLQHGRHEQLLLANVEGRRQRAINVTGAFDAPQVLQ